MPSLAQKSLLLFGGQSLTNYLLDLNAQGYVAAMYLADEITQATYTGTFAGTILRNAGYTSGPGAELVTNGDFSSSTGWITSAPWTISSGAAHFDDLSTNVLYRSDISLVAGTTYKLTFTISNTTDALILFSNAAASITFVNYAHYTNGTYTLYFIAPAASANFGLYGNTSGSTFDLDDFSLVKVGQLDAAIGGTTPWLAAGGLSFDGLTSYAEVLNNATLKALDAQGAISIWNLTDIGEGTGGGFWYWASDANYNQKLVATDTMRANIDLATTDAVAVGNNSLITYGTKQLFGWDYNQGGANHIRLHNGKNGAVTTLALATDTQGNGAVVQPSTVYRIGNTAAAGNTMHAPFYKHIIVNSSGLAQMDTILQTLTALAGV